MRLIDADELKKDCRSVPDPRGRYAELRIIEDYEIDDAPTIFEIPDNATNGDIIEKIFNTTSTQFCELVRMDNIDNGLCCSLDWWNSLYK